MPYPSYSLLGAFGGTLFSSESWVCTIRMAFPDPVLLGEAFVYGNTNASLFHSKVKAWYTAQAANFSTAVHFNFSKFNGIDPAGHYIDTDNSNTTFETGSGVAGTGTPKLPPQCTVALTWVTAAERGLAHSGRIYLPMLNVGFDTATGTLPAGSADALATIGQALANTINTLPVSTTSTATPKVTVCSKVREGRFHRVTGVKSGLVIDTQRRRRRQLVEAGGATLVVT